MAHAALISLKQTTQRLLNSSHVSISPPSHEILDFVYEEAQFLQKLLKQLHDERRNALDDDDHRRMMNALDRKIREAACLLEDALENHEVNLILSHSDDQESRLSSTIPMDLEELKQEDIESFIQTAMELKEEWAHKLVDDDDYDYAYVDDYDNEDEDGDNVHDDGNDDDGGGRGGDVNLTLSQYDDQKGLGDASRSSPITVDLMELKRESDSFNQRVENYIDEEEDDEEVEQDDDDDDDDDDDLEDDDDVTSRVDFGDENSTIVGFSDIFRQIRDLRLLTHWPKPSIEMVSLVGMAGIGKTYLAKEVFEDPSISTKFDQCAWVSVGPKYQFRDILEGILSQVNTDIDRGLTQEDDYGVLTQDDLEDCAIAANFYDNLEEGKYLIVLDDVWNTHAFDYFRGSFPYDSNFRILVLLTTRLDHVGSSARMFKMRFLNKEESWDLLREKVFGEEEYLCPPELEKAGKKIAENCEGLPLTIVTVADILSKAEKTPEYWNKVAEKQDLIFTDAYEQISEVLNPSYEYLPQHLKARFLYLAVFPQKYKIPVTKLGILWTAEGFFESNLSKTLSLASLEDFVLLNLVLAHKSSYDYTLKTCGLHSVFWHLCKREGERNKLFHVLNRYADSSAQGIRNQRRLCVHNNVLFGIKDVKRSMESISTARSLLCTGQYHQYPVPICFGLSLLRVLDALTIRFYEFPIEVVRLIQLRYLGLIYDGKLPSSISKLWNLQFLIVRRHFSVVKVRHELNKSYLPIEIWDMKELKHLQVMGSDLPNPHDGDFLPNLETLLDVSARSCTKGVLEGLPKLEKLGIRIESSFDDDDAEPFSCFEHISHLNKMESLKCVIVNPKLGCKVMAPPASSSLFPKLLEKLSLSGFGYTWDDMKVIASLPNLRVIKLRCYAFQGPKWEVKDGDFPRLGFLLIEDADLVCWMVGSKSFEKLEHLSLRNCYKLEEIHGKFGKCVECIEMVDCNPLFVNFAKQMQKDNRSLKLSVHSSWDDGKLEDS